MSREMTRLIGMAAGLLAVTLGAVGTARCDTIVLQSGYKFICKIHPDNKVFKHDPEQWVEFEIGSWTLDIPRSMVQSVEEDDLYVPPKTEAERKVAEQVIEAIMGEIERAKAEGVREQVAALGAEVTYLVNFADVLPAGQAQPVPAKEGDLLPEGSTLVVKRNSRGEVRIGEHVRVGVAAATTVELQTMKKVLSSGKTTWRVSLGLPVGKVWIDMGSMGAGETLEMNVAGCSFSVAADSLLSVTSALGTGYAFAYWRGPRDLVVRAPQHIEGGGFSLKQGYLVGFGAGRSTVTERRLPPGGDDEWNRWREFEPVRFDLEFRLIPPPLERLSSEDVQYQLRETRVAESVEVRGEIRTNVLQNVALYQSALESFRKDVGRCPTPGEGLEALREDIGVEGWKGPYVGAETQRLDPWAEPYRYRVLGSGSSGIPIVYSSGQNKIDEFGLGDDIR